MSRSTDVAASEGRRSSRRRVRFARTARVFSVVMALAPRDLKLRYRQSYLTIVWAFVTPILTLAVYGTVLTAGFGIGGAGVPYLSSAWLGLIVWTFFSSALGGAVLSIVSSAELISRVNFPKEALPLSVVLTAVPELVIGLFSFMVIAALQGVRPGITLIWFVVPLLGVALWTAALSIFVATFAAYLRDTVHAVNLILRVGFFATPVVYDAAILPDQLEWVMRVNPLGVGITGIRDVMLRGQMFSIRGVVVLVVGGLVSLSCAILYTRSVESRIVDVI